MLILCRFIITSDPFYIVTTVWFIIMKRIYWCSHLTPAAKLLMVTCSLSWWPHTSLHWYSRPCQYTVCGCNLVSRHFVKKNKIQNVQDSCMWKQILILFFSITVSTISFVSVSRFFDKLPYAGVTGRRPGFPHTTYLWLAHQLPLYFACSSN